MADFELLDEAHARRFRRWQRYDKMLFAARVLLVQCSIRAAISRGVEARLDPTRPSTPALRSSLLRVRASAVRWGHRAIAAQGVARVRLSALIGVRRGD